jgi:lipid II:glycine glycyltransferase (peptidoglycan interpeptide bridge formation enzyme)
MLIQSVKLDLGTPVNAKMFFQIQLNALNEHIRMLIVRKDNTPICVKWLFLYKNTILSSESATLRGYFPLRINDYQIYHAMKYAIENGFSVYNMGRSQRDTGAFEFKKSWGDLIVEDYPVYRNVLKEGITGRKTKYDPVIRIWKKTPVAITNLLGPFIRKNVELD